MMTRPAACLALGASLAAALCAAADDPKPSSERVVVEVATVSVRPLSVVSWIPGSIVSRADAHIASVIAGRVTWIADVGTRVRQGEPLARLDDTLPRLRLEVLRAQVARARATHDVANSLTRAPSAMSPVTTWRARMRNCARRSTRSTSR